MKTKRSEIEEEVGNLIRGTDANFDSVFEYCLDLWEDGREDGLYVGKKDVLDELQIYVDNAPLDKTLYLQAMKKNLMESPHLQ